MGSKTDTRRIAAMSLFVCACASKATLPDVADATDTAGVDDSSSTGEETGVNDDSSTGPGWGSSGDDTGSLETGDNPPMPGVGPAAVDILFVVDNSGSMGEEQANLQAAIPGFVDTLTASGLDYRIGITTTDNGNYWCRGSGVSNPEAGNLVFSSCTLRLDDFMFSTEMVDVRDVACSDQCTLDQFGPTNGKPWIENGGSNLPDGIAVADALRCLLPQGINGCGFEQPLESAHLAIRRSFTENEDELGFVRPDAHLMIVLISDEEDCSYNQDWETIFYSDDDHGNEAFWELPEENSPTSALCWNAGVECTGGPGTYAECHAQNYDKDRVVTDKPGRAVLHPLSRYQEWIDMVTRSKAESHAQVFLFGILGVPENYPSTRAITYADGPDPQEPSSFHARFGIAPGCSSENGEGVPPVRMREYVENNSLSGASSLFSICAPGYGSALSGMVNQVTAYVGG